MGLYDPVPWMSDHCDNDELSFCQDGLTRISRHGALVIVGGSIPRLHSLWRQTGDHVEGYDLIVMGDFNAQTMGSMLGSGLRSRGVDGMHS